MFHETAPVTSDPSDRRKGERSEDVLLALKLTYILTTNQSHVAHSQPRFNFKHRLHYVKLAAFYS